MQAYGEGFARIYNVKWAGYARGVAPLLLDFYASTPTGRTDKTVLDLCCGSGHLAVLFLEKGYSVVGIDLSEHMLRYARENAGPFVKAGQCEFIKADASDFKLDKHFGLVVSTYDSLNHLENEKALLNCFRCVRAVSGGYFIFDLNTRKGLQRWNGVLVDDSGDEGLILTRGMYDGQSEKAWMRITGFFRESDRLFKRFDETVFNTVFELEKVQSMLFEAGWNYVYFARVQDLSEQLAKPEDEARVFVVASS